MLAATWIHRARSTNHRVLGIPRCIYAILAVEFFGRYGEEDCREQGDVADGAVCWENVENSSIPLVTGRGLTYGEEYYGNFLRAIYTLFQVMTGESWSEAVARPLIFSSDGGMAFKAALFHVTFIIFCGVVLVNVVVAVLLEKMVGGDEDADEAGAAAGKHTSGIDDAASLEKLHAEMRKMEANMQAIMAKLDVAPAAPSSTPPPTQYPAGAKAEPETGAV